MSNALFVAHNSALQVESRSASEKEDDWARDRAECLARFTQAVAAGKRRDYAQCEAIIADVRAKHGDAAAEIAASELKKAIKNEGRTPK